MKDVKSVIQFVKNEEIYSTRCGCYEKLCAGCVSTKQYKCQVKKCTNYCCERCASCCNNCENTLCEECTSSCEKCDSCKDCCSTQDEEDCCEPIKNISCVVCTKEFYLCTSHSEIELKNPDTCPDCIIWCFSCAKFIPRNIYNYTTNYSICSSWYACVDSCPNDKIAIIVSMSTKVTRSVAEFKIRSFLNLAVLKEKTFPKKHSHEDDNENSQGSKKQKI